MKTMQARIDGDNRREEKSYNLSNAWKKKRCIFIRDGIYKIRERKASKTVTKVSSPIVGRKNRTRDRCEGGRGRGGRNMEFGVIPILLQEFGVGLL